MVLTNAINNPILSSNTPSMHGLSKSKSEISVASNSRLGNKVKHLKKNIEKTRKIKDRAIGILKSLKVTKQFNEVDNMLREYNN